MKNKNIEAYKLAFEEPFYFYCYKLLSQKHEGFIPTSEVRSFLGRNLKLKRSEIRQLLLIMKKNELIVMKNRGVELLA